MNHPPVTIHETPAPTALAPASTDFPPMRIDEPGVGAMALALLNEHREENR